MKRRGAPGDRVLAGVPARLLHRIMQASLAIMRDSGEGEARSVSILYTVGHRNWHRLVQWGMQIKPPPHPLTIQQQPTLYPERRMERRGKPEPGNRRAETGLIPGPKNHEPSLGLHGLFVSAIMPLCRAIRGRLGDRVYKTYGDRIVVTRVPCFDGYEPSAAQRQRREKMRAATAYAQAVYANPAARAIYVAAAKQLGRQPFRLAVSDFLRARPRVALATATPETTKVPDPGPRSAAGPFRRQPPEVRLIAPPACGRVAQHSDRAHRRGKAQARPAHSSILQVPVTPIPTLPSPCRTRLEHGGSVGAEKLERLPLIERSDDGNLHMRCDEGVPQNLSTPHADGQRSRSRNRTTGGLRGVPVKLQRVRTRRPACSFKFRRRKQRVGDSRLIGFFPGPQAERTRIVVTER